MAEVLVLVDHADGRLRKATAELLTIARRLGEPSAVHIGTGADRAQVTLAKYGAHKVYVVDDPDAAAYLVAPQAEILATLVEKGRRRPCSSRATPRARRSPLGCRSGPVRA